MGRPTNECRKPSSPYATYVAPTTTSTTTTLSPEFAVISYPDNVDDCASSQLTTQPPEPPPAIELVSFNTSYVCNSISIVPEAGGVILQNKICSKNEDGSANDCLAPNQNMLLTGLTTLCLDNSFTPRILSGAISTSEIVANCHCSGVTE